MSNTHIDKIFKDAVGEKKFANKDAMWQKMEAALDNDRKKRNKRYGFIALFTTLLIAGFFVSKNYNAPATAVAKTGKPAPSSVDNSKPGNTNKKTISQNQNSNALLKAKGVVSARQKQQFKTVATQHLQIMTPASEIIQPVLTHEEIIIGNENEIETVVIEVKEFMPLIPADDNLISYNQFEKVVADAQLIPVQYSLQDHAAIKELPGKALVSKPATMQRHPVKSKKFTIELIGGGDILRVNRKAGYYAGVRVNRLLEQGAVISFGLNYTNHVVNDKYRLADKPAQQKEIDGRLDDLTTIRVPVYFQRQLATTKFSLMAGLVPTYVVDATVYNVPNSFNGNPGQFRKFEIDDINRFNVLFGAGLKYAPLNWVAVELSGSYGFTSLVKNSYKNRSRVNDNFKSIQAGVVFKLK